LEAAGGEWLTKKLRRRAHGEGLRWRRPRVAAPRAGGVGAVPVLGRGGGQVAGGQGAPSPQAAQQAGRQEYPGVPYRT
jgi:hypothetical protein